MRVPLFVLALALTGCSSDSSVSTFTEQSAPRAQLLIDHSAGENRLTPEMTQLRVTGLSWNGREVITPPQTVPRADRITVPLDPRTRTVQIDYLNGSGDIVGQGMHGVQFSGGGGVQTLTDPFYDTETSDEKPDSSTGQYGLLGAVASPRPRETASPTSGINLRAYIPENWPLPLAPQYIPTSPYFGPNPTLPNNVTLTNLPPVGAQGTHGINLGYPGSCIGWSFGAELATFTAARNVDFSSKYAINNNTSGSNYASPMYLYEVALDVEPASDTTGSWKGKPLHCAGSYDIYTSFMVGYGAATTSTVPYYPSCKKMEEGRKIVATIPPDASLRTGSFNSFWPTDQRVVPATMTVHQIKQFLAQGQAVAFATQIWNNFDELPLTNGVYYGSNCVGGGHGMFLVGYNDSIGAPGREGAFLVQNSFGADWPQPNPNAAPCAGSAVPSPDASPSNPAGPGRFYLSYDAWYSANTGGAVAFPVDPTTPTSNLQGTTGAPAAAINSTYQVTTSDGAYLVLNHWFARPLYLTSLTLTTPDGKQSATQPLGYPMKNGYIWLQRFDNRSYPTGTWSVSLSTTDGVGGTAYNYSGNITVGNVLSPFPSKPAAALPANIIGVAGTNITVTGNL